MAQRSIDLSDLLTAAGSALGSANERLQQTLSPAMLSSYNFTLSFNSRPQVRDGDIRFSGVTITNPRFQLLACCPGSTGTPNACCPTTNTSLTVNVVAAPALVPVPPT